MPRGRLPEAGTPRDKALCLRMTKSEIKAMDAARGESSRTDFMRKAVSDASAKK